MRLFPLEFFPIIVDLILFIFVKDNRYEVTNVVSLCNNGKRQYSSVPIYIHSHGSFSLCCLNAHQSVTVMSVRIKALQALQALGIIRDRK